MSSLFSESLPDAVQSDELALMHIKISFLVGAALFVLMFPLYKSRKSYFDAIAARSVLAFTRMFVFVEILLIFVLYYFYFEKGPLMDMHQYLGYGNGDSWLYTYGRPTAGLVFIGFGFFGEIHPIPRYLCITGCMVEVLGDALSAFQVRDYYHQVKYHSAPSNGYSENEILAYYWRDIISIGFCTMVCLLVLMLTVQVGFCEPQLIHPSLIGGKELDRYGAMRRNKEKRQIMAMEGLLGPQRERNSLGITKARLFTNSLGPRTVDKSKSGPEDGASIEEATNADQLQGQLVGDAYEEP